MNTQNSYKIDEIAHDVDIEVDRLKAQVDIFWNKEVKHYIEFGLKDSMTVAEFGSGPGFLTEKLLNHFENISITSVEIDPYLVDRAKTYLGDKTDRLTISQGSILDLKYDDNTFDFVIVRLVLEHLPDPMVALKEVYRVLKPDGRVVFVDNDFEMSNLAYPEVPQLRELFDAYCEARYSEGGNPKIGRELPLLLKRSGFKNIDYEIICAHSTFVGIDTFMKSEGMGIPARLVENGFLSSRTLAELSLNWSKMIKSEEKVILRQLSMAVGQKIIS